MDNLSYGQIRTKILSRYEIYENYVEFRINVLDVSIFFLGNSTLDALIRVIFITSIPNKRPGCHMNNFQPGRLFSPGRLFRPERLFGTLE